MLKRCTGLRLVKQRKKKWNYFKKIYQFQEILVMQLRKGIQKNN